MISGSTVRPNVSPPKQEFSPNRNLPYQKQIVLVNSNAGAGSGQGSGSVGQSAAAGVAGTALQTGSALNSSDSGNQVTQGQQLQQHHSQVTGGNPAATGTQIDQCCQYPCFYNNNSSNRTNHLLRCPTHSYMYKKEKSATNSGSREKKASSQNGSTTKKHLPTTSSSTTKQQSISPTSASKRNNGLGQPSSSSIVSKLKQRLKCWAPQASASTVKKSSSSTIASGSSQILPQFSKQQVQGQVLLTQQGPQQQQLASQRTNGFNKMHALNTSSGGDSSDNLLSVVRYNNLISSNSTVTAASMATASHLKNSYSTSNIHSGRNQKKQPKNNNQQLNLNHSSMQMKHPSSVQLNHEQQIQQLAQQQIHSQLSSSQLLAQQSQQHQNQPGLHSQSRKQQQQQQHLTPQRLQGNNQSSPSILAPQQLQIGSGVGSVENTEMIEQLSNMNRRLTEFWQSNVYSIQTDESVLKTYFKGVFQILEDSIRSESNPTVQMTSSNNHSSNGSGHVHHVYQAGNNNGLTVLKSSIEVLLRALVNPVSRLVDGLERQTEQRMNLLREIQSHEATISSLKLTVEDLTNRNQQLAAVFETISNYEFKSPLLEKLFDENTKLKSITAKQKSTIREGRSKQDKLNRLLYCIRKEGVDVDRIYKQNIQTPRSHSTSEYSVEMQDPNSYQQYLYQNKQQQQQQQYDRPPAEVQMNNQLSNVVVENAISGMDQQGGRRFEGVDQFQRYLHGVQGADAAVRQFTEFRIEEYEDQNNYIDRTNPSDAVAAAAAADARAEARRKEQIAIAAVFGGERDRDEDEDDNYQEEEEVEEAEDNYDDENNMLFNRQDYEEEEGGGIARDEDVESANRIAGEGNPHHQGGRYYEDKKRDGDNYIYEKDEKAMQESNNQSKLSLNSHFFGGMESGTRNAQQQTKPHINKFGEVNKAKEFLIQ